MDSYFFSTYLQRIIQYYPDWIVDYDISYTKKKKLEIWDKVGEKLLQYYYQTEGIKYTKTSLSEFLSDKINHKKILYDLNYILTISKSGLKIEDVDFK